MRATRAFASSMRGILIIVMLSVPLCAATPPVTDGARIQGGVGAGPYQYYQGGCSGPPVLTDVVEVRAHFRFEQFWQQLGINFVGEVMLSAFNRVRQRTVRDGVPAEDLDVDGGFKLDPPITMLRLGYHTRYFGLEIGTLLFAYLPYLSANLWAGHRLLHGWVGLNDTPLRWRQPVPNPIFPVSFGLGHVTSTRRLRVGYESDGVAVQGHFRLGDDHPVWLGGRLNFVDSRSWGVIGYIGYELGGK